MTSSIASAAKGAAGRVVSVLERAKLVCWLEETNSLVQTKRRYQAEFGMDPPPLSQVKKWHQHFLSTGSVVVPSKWDPVEHAAAQPPLADSAALRASDGRF